MADFDIVNYARLHQITQSHLTTSLPIPNHRQLHASADSQSSLGGLHGGTSEVVREKLAVQKSALELLGNASHLTADTILNSVSQYTASQPRRLRNLKFGEPLLCRKSRLSMRKLETRQPLKTFSHAPMIASECREKIQVHKDALLCLSFVISTASSKPITDDGLAVGSNFLVESLSDEKPYEPLLPDTHCTDEDESDYSDTSWSGIHDTSSSKVATDDMTPSREGEDYDRAINISPSSRCSSLLSEHGIAKESAGSAAISESDMNVGDRTPSKCPQAVFIDPHAASERSASCQCEDLDDLFHQILNTEALRARRSISPTLRGLIASRARLPLPQIDHSQMGLHRTNMPECSGIELVSRAIQHSGNSSLDEQVQASLLAEALIKPPADNQLLGYDTLTLKPRGFRTFDDCRGNDNVPTRVHLEVKESAISPISGQNNGKMASRQTSLCGQRGAKNVDPQRNEDPLVTALLKKGSTLSSFQSDFPIAIDEFINLQKPYARGLSKKQAKSSMHLVNRCPVEPAYPHAIQIKVDSARAAVPLPSAPPLPPSSQYHPHWIIVSSTTLLGHRTLGDRLATHLPLLTVIERDFSNKIPFLPGPAPDEADVLLSASEGVLITDLQSVRQQLLPQSTPYLVTATKKVSPLFVSDSTSPTSFPSSPLRDHVARMSSYKTAAQAQSIRGITQQPVPSFSKLQNRLLALVPRYEQLHVIVTPGRLDIGDAGYSLDTRDQDSLHEFESFSKSLERIIDDRLRCGKSSEDSLKTIAVASVKITYLPTSSERYLWRWIAGLSHEASLKRQKLDLCPRSDDSNSKVSTTFANADLRLKSVMSQDQLPLLALETQHEIFLRAAGVNAYMAQVILSSMKHIKGGEDGKGLSKFIRMTCEERVRILESVVGGKKVLHNFAKMVE